MSANNTAREYVSALDSSNFMELTEMEEVESQSRSKPLTDQEHSHLKQPKDTVDKIQYELTAQLDVIHGKVVQQLNKEIEIQTPVCTLLSLNCWNPASLPVLELSQTNRGRSVTRSTSR